MNEIPNEIIEAAMRSQLPKFAKGGFIPLEGHPVGPNCDEKIDRTAGIVCKDKG